ncbi:MAG: hypothetical protein MI862_14985, partial [Desulfobacterales bacterium]|nr:hypothetical protein [Desulfobacterales bacterium]
MEKKKAIHSSKLMPPRQGNLLFRPRVNILLSGITHKKLALVCAGSGYGKTTAVIQFLDRLKKPYTWIRLSETEQDLFLFADYLISGLRPYARDFCRARPRAQYAGWGGGALGAYVSGEIQAHVTGDHYIVFDDWHLVEPSPDVSEFVRYLIENTPDAIHFILTSRVASQLPVAQLLTADNAVVIGRETLEFSKEDAAFFFRRFKGAPESRRTVIEKAVKKTGGWVAGLSLISLSMTHGNLEKAVDEMDGLSGADQLLANYIDSAVFGRLSRSEQMFLMQTSILQELAVPICNALLCSDT